MANIIDVLTLDATGQAELVRSGEVTSVEFLDATIDRIEQLNGELNAVVTSCYDQAREAAKAGPPNGPFSGVPYLLKDIGPSLAGVRLTSGSASMKDFTPVRDSELVVRLKQAGLIILGRTNTPEFGLLPTTEPQLFGPTRNPWDQEHTTGGSSGGSAAAVAAGMVSMAHGTDGGGSIRIPSSCCGLFGLKPTRGRTPMGPEAGESPGELDKIVRSLEKDGVTLVENQLTDEQCQQVQEGFEWGLQNRTGPRPLQRQRTYEWFREHPIFVDLIEHPLVIEVSDACLGPEYHLICAETTRNEKDNHFLEAVKDIHQDHCFFPEQPELIEDMQSRMYGFTAQWVIHDIPPKMGPTEFIVGSHIRDKLYTNEEAPSSISFRRHFPKGSLVFYDHRTWHRGTDNCSDTPRDLTQNCYALHSVDKVQIRTSFEDGSEAYVPCSDLLETGSDTIRKLLSPA